MDWIVKTFHGYIFESKMSFHQINSIMTPSVECLKIFMVKISKTEQNP